MPEGDTIWRTAAGLRSRLVGKVVRAALPARWARLEGTTVTSVEAVGKHLLMHFDSGVVLHTHMRMTGTWHVYAPGERWRKPAHAARIVLSFDDVEAVLFWAPLVELLKDAPPPLGEGSPNDAPPPSPPPKGEVNSRRFLPHLGPDILDADFDVQEAVRRARSVQPATLGELLLDQRVCAGVGNVYKCEALWELKLDPWAAPGAVDDATLAGLIETARSHMRQNLPAGGFDRRFGARRQAVHGRRGRPCPRCGTRIAARAQGAQARLTYFCPGCQSPNASGSDRAARRLDHALHRR